MQLFNPVWQALEIKKIFEALDYQLRFVGGAVRDSVYKSKPTDLDASTPFLPTEVCNRLTAAGYTVIPTGADFGTVMVLTKHSVYKSLEITTLRQDILPDGRHAKVIYTKDWQADASRRDFTFNALYADYDGTIYDYFNGIRDLKNGIVRFIGNPADRIHEDYLRILRYFRFFARFSTQEADPLVLAACQNGLEGLNKVSPERCATEFLKLLEAPQPCYALHEMHNIGLLQKYFPNSNLQAFDRLKTKNAAARWYILGHSDLSKYLPRPIKKHIALFSKQIAAKNNPFELAVALGLGSSKADDLAVISALYPHDNFDGVLNIIVPSFPLNGRDLAHLPPVQIGTALKMARERWLSHKGKPTKQELSAYLDSIDFNQTCSDQSNPQSE